MCCTPSKGIASLIVNTPLRHPKASVGQKATFREADFTGLGTYLVDGGAGNSDRGSSLLCKLITSRQSSSGVTFRAISSPINVVSRPESPSRFAPAARAAKHALLGGSRP